MSQNRYFDRRDSCPACESTQILNMLNIPFLGSHMKKFLMEYYENVVPLDIFQDSMFSISVCKKCEFVFQDNILNPELTETLYDTWISPAKSCDKKMLAPLKKFDDVAFEVKMMGFLLKGRDRAKILDFGCGWGAWLRMARAWGFDAVGCELSLSRQIHLQSQGLNLIDLDNTKPCSFDFIYCNQVLEHVEAPLKLLKTFSGLLKTGGIIYVSVPNSKKEIKKLKNGIWNPAKGSLQPLEHINSFTRSSLVATANKAGFQIVSAPFLLRFDSMRSFSRSMIKLLLDRSVSTNIFFKKV